MTIMHAQPKYKSSRPFHSPYGFTLIELLIVIAIIGILATIATVSLGSSQRRARDGQRKADLANVKNALEIYFSNKNGYPASVNGAITGTTWSSSSSWVDNTVSPSVNYIRNMPKDPLTTPNYCYSQTGGGTGYDLFANLENTNDPDRITTLPLPTCNSVNYNYRISNPF